MVLLVLWRGEAMSNVLRCIKAASVLFFLAGCATAGANHLIAAYTLIIMALFFERIDKEVGQ